MAVIENYIHPRHEGAQNILVTYVAWNGMIIILQTCHSDFQNEKKKPDTERHISQDFTNLRNCWKVQILETDSRLLGSSGWTQARGMWAGSQKIPNVSQVGKKCKKRMVPWGSYNTLVYCILENFFSPLFSWDTIMSPRRASNSNS